MSYLTFFSVSSVTGTQTDAALILILIYLYFVPLGSFFLNVVFWTECCSIFCFSVALCLRRLFHYNSSLLPPSGFGLQKPGSGSKVTIFSVGSSQCLRCCQPLSLDFFQALQSDLLFPFSKTRFE